MPKTPTPPASSFAIYKTKEDFIREIASDEFAEHNPISLKQNIIEASLERLLLKARNAGWKDCKDKLIKPREIQARRDTLNRAMELLPKEAMLIHYYDEAKEQTSGMETIFIYKILEQLKSVDE